jgi:hypothetical protein
MNVKTQIPQGITRENYDTHSWESVWTYSPIHNSIIEEYLICTKCRIKIFYGYNIDKIEGGMYIADVDTKISYTKYNLSCDEYSIKEIIE